MGHTAKLIRTYFTVMLSVITLNVVILSEFLLIVVAPHFRLSVAKNKIVCANKIIFVKAVHRHLSI
jgi:hypothetical protein